ncbi:hypothetical protein BDZ88DRAFT_430527 [Geranomyces variabilis]|nr:hypothetical protein BDZ88DRAFT_430527 [Geranomyces variabilis]
MGAIILLNVSRLSSVALAFAALVSLQTSAGLVYHFAAQSDSQGGYAFSPASALSMAEGINFLIAAWMYRASLLARCGGPTHSYSLPGIPEVAARMGNFVQSLRAQVANELLIQLCGLAVLSAINHYLVFALYQLTDPGTIQLIKFGAAFISPSLLSSFLGRDTSSLQWLLVVLQVAGLISTQYQTGLETHPISTYGLLLLSTAITFLCSYWNECLCKNYSASLKAQTLGLHALGSLINLAVFVFKACMGNEMGFFSGYDSVFAIIVVFLIASISICSRYVNSYADAFVKVIADSITTTILVLLSAILFQAPFTILTVTGSLVVFISNYIYVTYSPMSAPIQRCNERAPLRSKSEDLTAMPGKVTYCDSPGLCVTDARSYQPISFDSAAS